MPERKNENPHKDHRLRMKRQFIRGGIDQFEKHQVLELLLFFAIPRRDTNLLAHDLIDHFGNLPSVLEADFEELCQIKGISEHSATFLVLCGELLSRYHKEKKQRVKFSSFDEIKDYLSGQLIHKKHETVLLMSLNNRRELINCSVVRTGTVNATETSARELVQVALRDRATAVVVAHNHPAGVALPSAEDMDATRNFVSAFRMMDIEVLDHVIVAQDGCFSMRESAYYAPLFSKTMAKMDGVLGNRKDGTT